MRSIKVTPRRLGLEVFLFFLLLYLLTANGRIVNMDGEAVFQVTRSIAEHASFDVPSESAFELSAGPKGTGGDSLSFATETAKRGLDGRLYAMYGLGQSLVSAPFFYVGKLLAALAPSLSPFFTTRLLVALLNSFVSALTCSAVLAVAYSLGCALRTSLTISLVYGLATMAWPYAKSYFSEPLAGLLLIAAFLCLLRSSSASRPLPWLLLAGAALGFAVMVRVSVGVLLPVFIAYWYGAVVGRGGFHANHQNDRGEALRINPQAQSSSLLEAGSPPSARFSALPLSAYGFQPKAIDTTPHLNVRVHQDRPYNGAPSCPLSEGEGQGEGRGKLALQALTLLTPIAVFLALIGWYNYARFGSPFTTGYQSIAWSRPFVEGLYGLLLSPGKGIIWFNPVLIVSAIASVAFYRWRKREALFLAGLSLIWLGFHAPYRFWEGGWSWGPRLLLPILPFLILPIGSVDRLSGNLGKIASRLVPLVIALGLMAQVLGVGVDYTRYLWANYSTNPDIAYERVIFQLSGSPLVQEWGDLAAVVSNAARPGELDKARGEIAGKEAEWEAGGLPEAARSMGVLEETQVAGLNFPDFWFIYLYLFGSSALPVAIVAIVLLAGVLGMLVVLDRELRSLKPKTEVGLVRSEWAE